MHLHAPATLQRMFDNQKAAQGHLLIEGPVVPKSPQLHVTKKQWITMLFHPMIRVKSRMISRKFCVLDHINPYRGSQHDVEMEQSQNQFWQILH
ncbi:Os03g0790551 [Oryza sativa Japonica Group]|uniref:Os03g0790551 protein n=1 Tax=Oryza sativa subsp. japonica TaxID=39947 RepID=A0A0P0W426_ORYSJ|nr:hypothetical protein EE612_020922 [Oryza sativa]BAS86773.1 Os03g0790551 [Oryza sativa Japonica Group]